MVLRSSMIVTSKIVVVCRKTAVTGSNFDLKNYVYKFRELEYIYNSNIYGAPNLPTENDTVVKLSLCC